MAEWLVRFVECFTPKGPLQRDDYGEKCSKNSITAIFQKLFDFHDISLQKLCRIKPRITHKSCRSDELGLQEVLPAQCALDSDE